MGKYLDYVRHLYWKYEKQLDDFDKDVTWHGCIPAESPLSGEELNECARLWEEELERGTVD